MFLSFNYFECGGVTQISGGMRTDEWMTSSVSILHPHEMMTERMLPWSHHTNTEYRVIYTSTLYTVELETKIHKFSQSQ